MNRAGVDDARAAAGLARRRLVRPARSVLPPRRGRRSHDAFSMDIGRAGGLSGRTALLAAFTVVGVLAVSAMAQASVTATHSFDFATPAKATVLSSASLAGQDAMDFRAELDEDGDGDGTVTAAEAADGEHEWMLEMKQAANLAGVEYRVDRRAADVEAQWVEIKGAEGSVGDHAPLVFETLFSVTWDLEPGEEHDVSIGGLSDTSEVDDVSADAIVTVPPGYVVTGPANAPAGVTLSDDGKQWTIAGDAGLESSEFTFSMGRERSGGFAGVPGPGALLAGCALGVALGVAQVRRASGP